MIRRLALYTLLLAGFSSLCVAQSLGDAARQARKNKRITSSSSERVYTNESVGGPSSTPSSSTTANTDAATSSADATAPSADGATSDKAPAAEKSAKPAEGEGASDEDKKK